MEATDMIPATGDKAAEVPEYTVEMRELLERAQAGDEKVLPQLHELLDRHPELWRQFGELGGHVVQALIDHASGPSLLAKASIQRRVDALKAELTTPETTAVERLVDHH
jgi:hypothetical protein